MRLCGGGDIAAKCRLSQRPSWVDACRAAAKLAPMSRLARIVSTALITAGLVVLADVGLTLAYREPVSSLYGH